MQGARWCYGLQCNYDLLYKLPWVSKDDQNFTDLILIRFEFLVRFLVGPMRPASPPPPTPCHCIPHWCEVVFYAPIFLLESSYEHLL